MGSFIRIFLIIVIVYYIFKVIGKIFVGSLINHAKSNIRENQQQANRKKEGEVTLINNRKNQSQHGSNDGEYVDFEEVD